MKRPLTTLALILAGASTVGAQPATPPASPPAAAPTAVPPGPAPDAAEAPEGSEEPAPPAPGADADPSTPPPENLPVPAEKPPATARDEGDLPAWEPQPGTDPTPTDPGSRMVANWDAAQGPEARVSYPWIESHGYFRTRLTLFHNYDLDTYRPSLQLGTSPYLPPITEIDIGGSGHPEEPEHSYRPGKAKETLAGANMRFRYQPTVHVSENLRVKTTVDVLDNILLGSTPDGGRLGQNLERPDVPLPTFSGGQRPPESGVNSFSDSVRVKHLWGEWRTPVGLLMFGRMPSQWGLGILANSGNCTDCDFGDSVDRIMGVTKLFGTYLALGWDFVNEGVYGHPGAHTNLNQPYGQPHDFDQRDDVNEYVVAIFQRPVTQEEKEVRARKLNELREPAFDFGVYYVFRNQSLTTDNARAPNEDVDNEKLRDINAVVHIPDAWFNLQYRPRRGVEYQLQAEAVFLYGVIEELPQRFSRPKEVCLDESITDIADCPPGQRIRPRKREIQQYGYALEFDNRIDQLKWGFHQGLASGDKTDGFGVLDKTPLDPLDNTDQRITSYKFDRDYQIDMILFRRIIGSVTNAVYFKPYISYDLIADDTEAWGFKLSGLYAFALEETATPGNRSPLGLEFDLELYIHEFDRFRWALGYGLLFPFSAFDLLDPLELARGNRVVLLEPGIAQTLQMSITMQF